MSSSATARQTPRGVAVGAGVMLVASIVAPLMDAISKILVQDHPAFQVAWLRYVGHVAVLGVAAVALREYGVLSTRAGGRQLLRGVSQFVSTVALVAALQTLPLGTALTIVFLSPLLVVLVRTARRRHDADGVVLALSVVGLAAVALVYAPSLGGDWRGGAFALGAAGAMAVFILLTGKVGDSAGPLVSGVHAGLGGLILGAPPAILLWTPLDATAMALAGLTGVLSALCHVLIAYAIKRAMTPVIAPIGYAEVPAGLLYSGLFFAHVPAAGEGVGAALIVVVGALVAWRIARSAARDNGS